jgi:hypothetical protein
MKFKNIKGALFVTIGFSVVLAGCLKDKDYDNGLIQSVHGNTGKVVSIASNVQDQSNFSVIGYDNSNNDTVVNFLPIELSNGNSPAPQDIHVTVSQVDTLVNALDTANYNADDGSTFDYVVPAPSVVAVVSNTVVIKKGTYTGYLQLKFKPSDLLGQDLAFGFRITAIQESGYTISGNLSDAVVSLLIKNKYDGTYVVNGYFSHPTASFVGPFSNKKVVLATSQATAVDLNPDNQPSIGGPIAAHPRLIVDPATNLVTVVPSPGGPATIAGPVTPGYVNHYDPATRTFYIDYGYSGGTRHATDTLVYSGPR